MNAQSTQSRYINPSTSSYVKTSLFASTLQEKTKYISCFTVSGLLDKSPDEYDAYLDG